METDDKTATDVSQMPTPEIPAQNAATVTPIAEPGQPAGSSAAAAAETLVSPAMEKQILFLVENFMGQYMIANPPTINAAQVAQSVEAYLAATPQMEKLRDDLDTRIADTVENARRALQLDFTNQIDATRADILAQLAPMLAAAMKGATAPAAGPAVGTPAAAAHVLAIGDPVKVWSDAEHKTFLLGKVAAIHDGAHAFDVELEGGSVSKVGADGLAFDDRA